MALPVHRPRASKLDAFKPLITELLEQDPHAPGVVILQRLRAALGDHNDLTVLAEFALTRVELTPEQKALGAALIARKRRPLERRAAQLYARLFAERPSAFERRIAAYLEHPRRKPPARRPARPAHAAAAPSDDGSGAPHMP